MGKKTKIGKQRKDKFYHLAKETGYRSRAAFKLIQLNRKFEFLQKSKVCVDLCAAPGGWMQVAVEHMPVASLIIGVDLFPIKPISGCIALQEDITTPRCLQLLKKEMKTWKADVVLHDGAPNVGQNWLHDAYGQNCLTLSAFKLATELLRPGGYFVTKVFRSKDYNSLLWVLQQFFKNVYSTKPAASRTESAEIFVVCKGYLAPTSIDPKFLDPKHVFEDVDVPDTKKKLKNLLQSVGKKKKPEGYPEGEVLLYRPVKASEFIRSSDYVDVLANTSQITIDEDWIAKSELTTQDIRDYCEDVKVLGRKEIKALIEWRKALRDKLDQYAKLKSEGLAKSEEAGGIVAEVEEVEAEEEEDEEKNLEDAIAELQEAELREAKRKKKKLLKERTKIREKQSLKMIIPGDAGPTDTSEDSLFTLKTLKSAADVENLTDKAVLPEVPEEPELTFEEELKLFEERRKAKRVSFNKEEEVLDDSGRYYRKREEVERQKSADSSDDEEDEEPDLDQGLALNGEGDHELNSEEEGEGENEEMDFEELAPIDNHPLITDLDHSDKNQKRLRKAQMWFDKPAFQGLDDESDEDLELDRFAESVVKSGGTVIGYDAPAENGKAAGTKKMEKQKKKAEANKRKLMDDSDDEDIASGGDDDDFNDPLPESKASSKKSKKKAKLDIQGMALGSLIVQSKKTKRDLMDEGWNRYAFNDDGLPDWFVEDERKHMKKPLPVPSDLVDDYKKKMTEINARPIKKVAEAKARNKKRAIRKLEKAKKKAEAILDKSDMTESEKANQIRQLYKKAMNTKKKEVTYVVAKKFNTGKKIKRPAGVKGPVKVVDPRMKKDLRAMKRAEARKGGKGAKRKGGAKPRPMKKGKGKR